MIRNSNKFKLIRKSIVDIITIGAVALSSFSVNVSKKAYASEVNSYSSEFNNVDDLSNSIKVKNISVKTDSDFFNFFENVKSINLI